MKPTNDLLSDKKNGRDRPTTLPSQLKNNPAFSKSVNQATSSPAEKPVAPKRISEPTRPTPTGHAPASRVSFSAASNNGASTKPPATAMQLYSMPTLTCSEDLNGGARENGTKLKSIENSVVANFSLRERIIHILALKPLKKIELLTQLEKHGLKDRDRMAYVSVCCEVAQRNSTTNEYVLSRQLYRELKPNWPLYTEENRAVIRSLLEKLKTSPVESASNTPDLVPCPSTNNKSPIGSRQPKMPGPPIDEANYTLPASKKQRIAHAQPPSAQHLPTQQLLQQSQPAQQPLPQPLQQHPKESPKKKVRTKSAPNENSSVQPKVPGMIQSKNKPDNKGNCSTQQPLQQSQPQPAQQPAPQPLQQHPKELPKKEVHTMSAPNKNSSVPVQPKVPDSIKSMNNKGDCSTQQPLQQSQQQPAQQPPPRPLQQHPKESPKKKVRTKSAPNENFSVQPKVPGMIQSKNKPDNRGNCSTQQPLQQSQPQPAQQPAPQPLQQHPKELPKKEVHTMSAPNKNSSVPVQPKVPDSIKSMNKQDNRGNCSMQQPLQLSQQQPAQQPPPRPLQQHPKELQKKEVHTKNSSFSAQPKVPDSIKSKDKQDNRGVSNGAAPSAMDESGQKNVNYVSVPPASEDYLRKYVEILTDEQRNSYNNDFNAEYDEYKMLSEKTSDRTKIIQDLNAKMKSTDDIDVYEHFRNEIMSEYDKLKCDTKYAEQKVRCAHLHVKLAHIRKLVTDYDQRSKSASSS